MLSFLLEESLSSSVATKWIDRLLSPAFGFWAFGLTIFLMSDRDHSVDSITQRLFNKDAAELTGIEEAVLLFGAVALITMSAAAIDGLGFGILRACEGYWGSALERVGSAVSGWQAKKAKKIDEQWNELAQRFASLTPRETTRYARLDKKRDLYPQDRSQVMPTLLGNVIKSAEVYSKERYGLPAVLIWPRLWLVLPESTRSELSRAQEALGDSVKRIAWIVLLLVWAPMWLLLVPFTLAAAWIAYRRSVAIASEFGHLLRATYDVYHRDLFKALAWPLHPDGPTPDRTGSQLTLFLKRGKLPDPAESGMQSPDGRVKRHSALFFWR
jgi:hypothetical protein